jgi:hypothetical protein
LALPRTKLNAHDQIALSNALVYTGYDRAGRPFTHDEANLRGAEEHATPSSPEPDPKPMEREANLTRRARPRAAPSRVPASGFDLNSQFSETLITVRMATIPPRIASSSRLGWTIVSMMSAGHREFRAEPPSGRPRIVQRGAQHPVLVFAQGEAADEQQGAGA